MDYPEYSKRLRAIFDGEETKYMNSDVKDRYIHLIESIMISVALCAMKEGENRAKKRMSALMENQI